MATFTVTNADDSGAGSLRQAVLDADETARADTIVFGAGFDGGAEDVIRLTGGQIRIRAALTIDGGDGVTITGDAAGNDRTDADGITDVAASGARRLDDNSRIFVAGDDLTLDGLTLTGGRTTARDANGGAVRAAQGLILINSTVSGNSANGAGGGIYGDEIIVKNSTVSRNSSIISGGGIGVGEEGSIAVRSSTISRNRTLGSGGGLSGNSDTTDFAYASITVRNSTIRDNSSTGSGGGIAVGEVSNVTVRNSTVSGNSTLGSGGGILTDGLLLKNSTICGNSVGRVYSVGGGIAGDYLIL